MASTSSITHGADGEPENPEFFLDHGLTRDVPLRRDGPPIYKYLEALRPASPNSVDGSQPHWTPGGEADANSVPMQLLREPQQEMNDLLLIYPGAKVQGNRITTKEYIFVLKRLLFNRLISGDDTSGVPHPQSFARLLRRLSRELQSAPASVFKFAYTSDPSLYDMLRDIEETDGEILKASEETDLYVYVRGNIDIYVQYLLAAASELSTLLDKPMSKCFRNE